MVKKDLEDLTEENDRISLEEKSETAQVFDNLDSETKPGAKTNPIDLNSVLSEIEVKNLLVLRGMKMAGLASQFANIDVDLMRMNVSKKGLGREQKVTIASAVRGAELAGKSGGIMGQIGSFFTPKPK